MTIIQTIELYSPEDKREAAMQAVADFGQKWEQLENARAIIEKQAQRIAELEAANADLRKWVDATGQGAMLKRVSNLEADVARQKERIFASWARQKELEAALDVAMEAMVQHGTSRLNHEDQYAEAVAKLKGVRKT